METLRGDGYGFRMPPPASLAVVLDDWIDGTGYTPDQVLASLRQGMGDMGMAASPHP